LFLLTILLLQAEEVAVVLLRAVVARVAIVLRQGFLQLRALLLQ
jgi:hypothetical protein